MLFKLITILIALFGYIPTGLSEKRVKTPRQQSAVKDSVNKNAAASGPVQPLIGKKLKELSVTAGYKSTNTTSNTMGQKQITVEEIRKIPVLMGEVDLLKATQLLPGVTTINEGMTGFSVRGGSADQNLIVLDEATIYNASHLLGFFSIFNNDAIKSLLLYKGDVPVLYDGRISSLLEVHTKDGDFSKLSGSGGISPIAARFSLTGPLNNGRTTFLVAARRTFADLLLKLSPDQSIRNNKLNFYDFNFNLNHRFDTKNRLFISGYRGNDYFKTADNKLSYGNGTISIRWYHLFSNRYAGNLLFTHSNYRYNLGSTVASDESNFDWKYSMSDYNLKYKLTRYHNRGTTSMGYQVVYHRFLPGTITTEGGINNPEKLVLPRKNSLEQAIYLAGEMKLSDRITAKTGIRLNTFSNVGSTLYYRFDDNHNVTDSIRYDRGEFYNTYIRLSPRIGVCWQPDGYSSIKANYSHSNQFLQMASNSSSGTPLDLWFSSGPNVKPQTCDQFALGYYRNFRHNTIEASCEVYLKKMYNTIDFRDYAQLLHNRMLEGELRFGHSTAYGVEFLLQKTTGKTTGWLSYAYSKSTRTIKGINNDLPYTSPYNRPHTVYLVASRELGTGVTLGTTFVYTTGSPTTFPVAKMALYGVMLPIYSGRNADRMPDYHRLDLSLTWQPRPRKKHLWSSEWNLSIYNVYARKNAWIIDFIPDYTINNRYPVLKAQKTYLFSTIPSVTYNFKF